MEVRFEFLDTDALCTEIDDGKGWTGVLVKYRSSTVELECSRGTGIGVGPGWQRTDGFGCVSTPHPVGSLSRLAAFQSKPHCGVGSLWHVWTIAAAGTLSGVS